MCAAWRAQYYKPFAERLGRDAANRRLVQAVDTMRPRINNSPPTRYSHLANNRKRRSMAEGAPPCGNAPARQLSQQGVRWQRLGLPAHFGVPLLHF